MVSGDMLTKADDGLNVPGMRQAAPWIVACAACAWLVVVLHNERRQTVELARIRSELSASNLNASREIVHMQQELAEARTQLVASRRELAGRRAAAKKAADPSTIDLNSMRNDPAYAGVWREWYLRTIQLNYGDALAALHLPPAKLTKLQDLLVDKQEANLDAYEAAKAAHLSDADVMEAASKAVAEVDDQIKEMLGADVFTDFQQNCDADIMEGTVDRSIGADLGINGVPLTHDQLLALSRVFSEANNPTSNPGIKSPTAFVADPVTGLSSRDQWLLDQASSVLSPEQLQTMKQSLLLNEKMNQFSRQLSGAKLGR
jgi:hypothetical protein